MEQRGNRILWLDIGRGICINLMVICHACNWAGGRWAPFNGVTGQFFLVFFFFCSGICFQREKTLGEYIRRQSQKTLLPYAICTVIYLVAALLRGYFGQLSFSKALSLVVLSLLYSLPSDQTMGVIQTVGIGPIWFLTCIFVASVLYKLLDRMKYGEIVILALAVIATLSQRVVTLPLTVQDACIGCMFFLLGDRLREHRDWIVWWKKRPIVLQAVAAVAVSFLCFSFTGLGYMVPGGGHLDLGSNVYSFSTLPATLAGFATVISLSLLLEDIPLVRSFLAYGGKNSFYILMLHSMDILLLRTWKDQSLLFMFSTLLLYPAVVFAGRWIGKKYLPQKKN